MTTSITNQSHPPASLSIIRSCVSRKRQRGRTVFRSTLRRTGVDWGNVLGVLAFLQRMEIQHNNGRRWGRAFVDFLRVHFPKVDEPEAAAPLVI